MNSEARICPICGSADIIKKDGEWFCKSCDTYFYDKVANDEQKIGFISRKVMLKLI